MGWRVSYDAEFSFWRTEQQERRTAVSVQRGLACVLCDCACMCWWWWIFFILAVDCYLIMSLDVVRVFPCVFWLLILFSVSLSYVLLFSPMYNTYSICIFFLGISPLCWYHFSIFFLKKKNNHHSSLCLITKHHETNSRQDFWTISPDSILHFHFFFFFEGKVSGNGSPWDC